VSVLKAFGAYLPARIVPNQELGCKLNRTPDWILDVSGIEQRGNAVFGTGGDDGGRYRIVHCQLGFHRAAVSWTSIDRR
jgi:hypothetical protein